jgi:translocation and assembly module TamB
MLRRRSAKYASAGGGMAARPQLWRCLIGLTLDVAIKAPQQIFVRGRGLDAELGGELRLTGPLASAVADGNFEMRRGRLDIFTQRITFSRGVITFAGDLDPVLDFSGSTRARMWS